jgi:hypothetical protein
MIFSKDDLKIEGMSDLIDIAPIFIFVGFVAPFLIAAYTLGFLMDVSGLLTKPDYPK